MFRGIIPRQWLAVSLSACVLLPASGQQPPPVRLDPTKNLRIERPAANIVRNAAELQKMVNALSAANPANPTVKPGEVRWHPSFAAACDAAKKSGKPVLLFHLMGRLDHQFC